MHIFQWR